MAFAVTFLTVDVACERREPTSDKYIASRGDQLINHSEEIRVDAFEFILKVCVQRDTS